MLNHWALSYLSPSFSMDVETCGLIFILNSPGEYYAFNIYSWLTYLLAKYAHIHLPNGLMPANILVTHMSLAMIAKKISSTCMLHLLKTVEMKRYYYANFQLHHTYLGEFPKQQRSTTKKKVTSLRIYLTFHNISSGFFGTFDRNICNYTAGTMVILQLSAQTTTAWTPLSTTEFGSGLGRATSVGGSVPSPCLVLLKCGPSAFPSQKDNNLLSGQNANKPGRVCVAIL